MAKILEQNAHSQDAIHPERAFCFEIEAILASFGFDRFRPWRRWPPLRYRHITAVRRLALNEIASNLRLLNRGFEP
jgi:hypothetical protein